MRAPFTSRIATVLAFTLGATLPAWAASSASSASSDSVSASVGSISTSFEKSSDSSKADQTAAGDYKVVDVAEAPQRPGMTRLKLQALAKPGADGEFFLYMPVVAAEQSRLAPGAVITATARPYGLQFAKADTREPFFLVLDDGWHRELQTKAVTL